ncbi:uncharacterized protein A4U43_C03F940 [Asparagus officinalis]|uniref:NAP1-related protein 2 n=1 Tax=Asparagus officinalis TaxID=4686 RepID=A0A5P1FBK6_ASPOF|nr:NAP1-related protein 2-like [Asparagus officinalis]ONK73920.1 uncharacterized protein A4U43_C03F940 [Asparagus officinalis]
MGRISKVSTQLLQLVNEEASHKVSEVEQKYNEIRRPVYLRRNQIIESISEFWLSAFLSHLALGDLLSDEDQEIFKYFVSLDVEDFKDVKSGYSITFTFSPNPYFEDTKLTKAFSFSDEGAVNITGTSIKWKEGKNIANGIEQKKKGKKRPYAGTSFFRWFSETHENDMSEIATDEVADMIKEDLWPNPLKYFNNEADEDDSDEDDDGEHDFDDEENDYDDSDESP